MARKSLWLICVVCDKDFADDIFALILFGASVLPLSESVFRRVLIFTPDSLACFQSAAQEILFLLSNHTSWFLLCSSFFKQDKLFQEKAICSS